VIERVGKSVRRELVRFGPTGGMEPVVQRWQEAVGVEIARNAWPARLGRDGTLHVHAKDSIWAFELTSRAEEIRVRLGEEAPPRLVFTPGPLPEQAQGVVEQADRTPLAPTPEQLAEAESLVRGIRDSELRKVVAKAVAASLARANDDRAFW
jgi:Dna[CI] antecedent, DciA